MRSKFANEWRAARDEEIQALKDKMPVGQRAIKPMWVYSVKADHLGYVVRFKARIVARGDKQRQGIDFQETFSPVVRMDSFRVFLVGCVLLHLIVYQGDNNAAYRNALLAIKQYLEEVEGYPSEENGMIYMINKAVYGLRQSGREWNSEVNSWLIRFGFKRCATEPYLYFYNQDGEFALVLLYVDDILCATRNEAFKKRLFS
ncbi:reverse transcriptase [Phytophthora megakarya]|uniref:Reverse transcriptase n=1 Tax=Phytophthora megakarya TaxID=4795 RepID=A0A225V8F8_9STRA|nr:reverse transcriptase [Phytophthora megakarya]